MEDTPTPNGQPLSLAQRKACQITIMFPVEDDDDALDVKKQLDAVVGDIKDKRYTFNITEM